MENKNVYIIAGPNGSGKTTFAKEFLPIYAKCKSFINADLIAQGLSPFYPQVAALRAGRLVLEQIHYLANRNINFAFETTLSGKSYIRFLTDIKKKGYHIHLYFLWIPTPELAILRIKERVREGGHNVPEQDVKRRFYRGINNFFNFYKPILNSWILFDNSGDTPRMIAEGEKDKLTIIDNELYKKIKPGEAKI